MNKAAKEILNKLEQRGYTSYIVGGYVRDFLLGKNSNDIDICTNATMKEVMTFLPGKVNEYNSINIKMHELNIDITTFREERRYENRRPIEMVYISDLNKDLLRRDFTINTICMDKDGKIIDPLNGINDLHKRLIKVVGDPLQKIIEDPLRILRAIRFATVLDFDLDEALIDAIKKQGHLLKQLSAFRVKEEVSKILTSIYFKKGLTLLKEYQLCEYLGISYTKIVYTKDLCGMWAQIKMHRNFPFTKREKDNIVKIQEILEKKIINREVIYKYGLYLSLIAGEILGIEANSIHEIYKNMSIHFQNDLDITYNEIVEVLHVQPSKKVKEIENDLIKDVINNRIKNENAILKEYLLTNRARWLN